MSLGAVKYEMMEFVGSHATEFRLYENGTFTVDDQIQPWWEERKGVPWIPRKYKAFKSLVKQMIRDQDYDWTKKGIK